MVGITDDDVVEDFDFKKLAGSDEVVGDFDVGFARGRVSTGVIVRDHDCGRAGHDRNLHPNRF